MVRITSKQAGFRRCGVAHPAEPTEYPDGRFSPKELKLLQSEPMLVVEIGGSGQSGGGNDNAGRPNAKETIALILTIKDVVELDKLAAENQDRKSVLDAIDKQRKALEQPEA